MSKKKLFFSSLKLKIVKFCRSYRWPLIIGTPLLLLFLLLVPIMKKDWLSYPAPLRAKLALGYLLEDQARGSACRETCQKQRQQYLSFVLAGGEQARLETKKALVSPSTNSEIRRLLIRAWLASDWEAPEGDILALAPSLELQAMLVEAWPELAPANWWLEISQRFYESSYDEERLLILGNLLGRGEPIAEELIVAVLINPNYSEVVLEQAYFLWANLPNRERAESLIPLTTWKEILFNPDYAASFKEMIVWGWSPGSNLTYEGKELKELLQTFLASFNNLDPHLSLASETVLFEWLALIPDFPPESTSNS